MRRKFLMFIAVILLVFTMATSAYANSTYVLLTKGMVQSISKNPLYVRAGHDLHVKVTSTNFEVSYRVIDSNMKLITSGTVTNTTPKAYSRGVPEGNYFLILKCEVDDLCSASGALND